MNRFFFRYLPTLLMVGTLTIAGAAIWSDLQKNTPKEMVNTAQAEAYPSVLCTNGTTVIVRSGATNIALQVGEKSPVVSGDIVKTLTLESTATIFWSEGSVTRLGGKTSLEIKETGTKDQRKVDFSLQNGKTYSRIFEYLRSDEYFQERYDGGNQIASVRGTAFEVNADGGYVRSLDHTVELIDAKKQISTFLSEGKAVSLSNSAMEFSQKLLDDAWEKFNNAQDQEVLKKYIQTLSEKFGNLADVLGSGSGKLVDMSGSTLNVSLDFGKIASGTLSPAQTSAIADFYYKIGGLEVPQEAKNSIRSYLLASATGSEATLLESDFAKHSLYDLAAAQKAGNTEMVKQIQEMMQQYKVDDTMQKSLDALKESLYIEEVKKVIGENIPKLTPKQKEVLQEKVDEVNMTTEEIQKKAEETVDAIFNSLSQ